MEMYYKNNLGQSVDFMDWPYMVSESDLFDYAWAYESRDSVNPKISRFYRELVEKSLKISVAALSQERYRQAVQNILEVTEQDVLNRTPGRLWVNGEYLSCYFIQSQKSDWVPGVEFLVNTFSIVSETGFWIRETPYIFKVSDPVTTNNKKYAYRYAYRYANGLNNVTIVNDHFAPAHFRLIFYGPCTNPHVIIGEHRYQVNILLEVGEYLTVDSRARTVKKTMVNGTIVNAFHNRSTQDSVFEKIPPGTSSVSWPGTFDFDLTLLAERSEPEWT